MGVTYCRSCGEQTPADTHPCLVDFRAALAASTAENPVTPEQALEAAKRGHADREVAAFFALQRLKLQRNIDGLHADTGAPLDTAKLTAGGLTLVSVKASSEKMLADLDKREAVMRGEVPTPAQEMALEDA